MFPLLCRQLLARQRFNSALVGEFLLKLVLRLAALTVRDRGMGALASRVLASIDILLFFSRPSSADIFSTQSNTVRCVSISISRRLREIVV